MGNPQNKMLLKTELPNNVIVFFILSLKIKLEITADKPGPHIIRLVLIMASMFKLFQLSPYTSRQKKKGHENKHAKK